MKNMQTPDPVTRNHIMATARALFTAHGYDQTSLQMLLQELGISEETFTSFFSSKDILLEALWSE